MFRSNTPGHETVAAAVLAAALLAAPAACPVAADDGIRLTIDGVLGIDEWRNQPPATFSVLVTLESITHTIDLRYFGDSGDALAGLSWKRLSSLWRTGPTSRVRPIGKDR
jgi:hypothetical protein